MRGHRQEKGGIRRAKKDSSISKTGFSHNRRGDDGVRNFEVPTAYHTPYDEVQKIKS